MHAHEWTPWKDQPGHLICTHCRATCREPVDEECLERWYDEAIAPELLRLAKACQERGAHLLAVCEWEKGETGHTYQYDPERPAGMPFLMALFGARARGNADVLLHWLLEHGKKHGHGSALLHVLDRATGGEAS